MTKDVLRTPKKNRADITEAPYRTLLRRCPISVLMRKTTKKVEPQTRTIPNGSTNFYFGPPRRRFFAPTQFKTVQTTDFWALRVSIRPNLKFHLNKFHFTSCSYLFGTVAMMRTAISPLTAKVGANLGTHQYSQPAGNAASHATMLWDSVPLQCNHSS